MSKRGFIFNSVRFKKPKRNAFNLSYENKMSCDMGKLYPFMVMDVLPNDTIKVGQEYLMKTQPLLAPLMHRVDVYQHYFFVPLRLIWENFEKFITGGEDGSQTATHPFINSFELSGAIPGDTSYGITGSLLDYLGYPNNPEASQVGSPNTDTKMSSLRIRAYNLIWNEYFRDQNLQQPVLCPTGDGHDTSSNCNMNLLYRAWRKDYFTSALPFQQRGPQVNIPYSGGNVVLDKSSTSNRQVIDAINGNQWSPAQVNVTLGQNNTDRVLQNNNTNSAVLLDPNGTLKVDDISIPINELRRANALQRWFERNARAGSRYVEQILSHFGIHPSDYRLQRPQYLGGGKQPFTISDVVQVSETQDSPQGTLAGKGSAHNTQYVFKETFEEHGIIIGLLSVLPRGAYMQGCDRTLLKSDKFDYPFPEFGNLGEQEVLNKELYFVPSGQDSQNGNDSVFGYQARYAEYKYRSDEVHGDFRSSLYYWHLARLFANRPLLNSSFVECKPDGDRVFAVNESDHLLFDFYNHIEVLRCLPAYGTPAL